jgi:hypothetical protein
VDPALAAYVFDAICPFLVGYFHSAFHPGSGGTAAITPVAEHLFQLIFQTAMYAHAI